MRQAGRSLPEYLKLREGIAMLDSCFRTDMVVEITMQPVRRYGVDAAIFFSDIVVPLAAVGLGVEIRPGVGPVVDEPFRTAADLDRLPELDPAQVPDIAEAVRFLAGPESSWITGASLPIDGGHHLRRGADYSRLFG